MAIEYFPLTFDRNDFLILELTDVFYLQVFIIEVSFLSTILIFDLSAKQEYCCVWDKSTARRGAN